jgi:hypothetical protein
MAAMSREQFVEQVLQYVHEKFPLVKISRGKEPFSMLVNGHLASMENVYRMAVLQPEDVRHHIERWVVELVRAAEGTPDRTGSFEELRDRILPMIVADGERDRRTMVTEPLLEGLSVAYAIDSDRTIAYIPESQFKEWSVDQATLHEAAIENLVKRSESMSAHAAQDEDGKINLILFQTMDGYDASRVLLPNLHEKLREHLGSPFVAAIPNRDILLCFRNEDATVERLREQIEADHKRMPHGVTDRLLLVTPDGIAPRD